VLWRALVVCAAFSALDTNCNLTLMTSCSSSSLVSPFTLRRRLLNVVLAKRNMPEVEPVCSVVPTSFHFLTARNTASSQLSTVFSLPPHTQCHHDTLGDGGGRQRPSDADREVRLPCGSVVEASLVLRGGARERRRPRVGERGAGFARYVVVVVGIVGRFARARACRCCFGLVFHGEKRSKVSR
jgi:hypothetical protein